MQALHKIGVTYFLVMFLASFLDEQSAWRGLRTIRHAKLRNGLPSDRNNGDMNYSKAIP
jgi:hypothetical protein